jgi:hypothetical protein
MSISDRLSSPLFATQRPWDHARRRPATLRPDLVDYPVVAASISVTVPSAPLATQTFPSDSAIAVGFEPTSIV